MILFSLSKMYRFRLASKRCISVEKLKIVSNVYSSDFWRKFWQEASCFMDLLPKIVKKYVSSTFADSSKNFLSDSTKKLPGLCDGHWSAWRSSSGRFQVTLGRGKVVRLRYSSDVEQFFSICFTLSDDLLRLSSPVCIDKTRPFGKIFKPRFVVL